MCFGELIILKIDDVDKTFIESGSLTYISMKANSKKVKIICNKDTAREGYLEISINDKKVEASCQFYTDSDSSGYYCLNTMIELDLVNSAYNSNKEAYDIKCNLIVNSIFTVNKKLYKLCKSV